MACRFKEGNTLNKTDMNTLFPWLTSTMEMTDIDKNKVAVVDTQHGDFVLLKARAKTLDFYDKWVFVAFSVEAYRKVITAEFDMVELHDSLVVTSVQGTSLDDIAIVLGVPAMTLELRKIYESLTNDTEFVWHADRLYVKDVELIKFSNSTQMYVDMFGAMLTSKYMSPLMTTSLCFCSRNCYHFMREDLMLAASDIDVGLRTLEQALIRAKVVATDGDLRMLYYSMPSIPGEEQEYYVEFDKVWVDRWKSLDLERAYLQQSDAIIRG